MASSRGYGMPSSPPISDNRLPLRSLYPIMIRGTRWLWYTADAPRRANICTIKLCQKLTKGRVMASTASEGAATLGEQVEHDLREGGLLSEALPGYEERPAQIEMARRVAQAVETGEHLI